jgi:uncharacterized protein YgiM (DUF1202 family)
MIIKILFLLLLLTSGLNIAHGEEKLQQVVVADPYIDVHTGHGESYPIFHVIEKGETIEIIVRHTSWFKVRNKDGVEGWVSLDQMKMTLSPDSQEQVEFQTFTHEDYVERRWEAGLMGGRFKRADTLTMYGAYLFNKSLAAELSWAQVLASNSSSDIYKIGLVMQPFPTLRVSPYVTLGTGVIEVKPKSTLVKPDDTSNQISNFGLGIRTYISKRIIVRLEYSNYIIFSANSNNDQNEDVKEWKAGFAIFF